MGGAGSGADSFSNAWQFRSTIDPEELFRKIFGEAGFRSGSTSYDDFAESAFGFGASQEAQYFFTVVIFNVVDF